MDYCLFGTSGLRVSSVCLGTLGFGSDGADGVDVKESQKIFESFAEAGGTFVDTAHGYGGGRSERTVGELLGRDRDAFVLATKYSVVGPSEGTIASAGNSRRSLRHSVTESLKRLNTDYIDLLYLHIWDFTTGWHEILSTMDALVSQGVVNYVAVSNTPAWEVSRANTMAEFRGWEPLAGIQVNHSLADRSSERELLPMAVGMGLGVTAYSPLGGGALAARVSDEGHTSRGWPISPAARAASHAVADLAETYDCPPSQIALAWMLQDRRWGRVIPVIGATQTAHVDDAIAALQVELSASDIAALNEATAIDIGHPYDRLFSRIFRESLTGFSGDALEDTRPAWGQSVPEGSGLRQGESDPSPDPRVSN